VRIVSLLVSGAARDDWRARRPDARRRTKTRQS